MKKNHLIFHFSSQVNKIISYKKISKLCPVTRYLVANIILQVFFSLNLSGQIGTIFLISPDGGEEWRVGSVHYITWENTIDIDSVSLEYSLDAGVTWSPVINYRTNNPVVSVPSSTSNRILWKIPDAFSNTVLLRVTESNGASTTESDSLFSFISSRELVCDEWEFVDYGPFAGRDGAGALTYNNKMWLLGGWNPSDSITFPNDCNSEVWSSLDGVTWYNDTPQAFWEGRHTAGYVVFQDKMWIVGGDPVQGHYQPNVWNSSDGVNWSLVNDSVDWGIRALHHTLVFDNKIWVMGGQTLPQFAPESEYFYNDVWNSEDGVIWNKVKDSAAWSPRGMIGGNVVMNGKMWLLGGGTYDTPLQPYRNFYNEVWSSSNGIDWELVNSNTLYSDAPWDPRQYHDVIVYNERIWVLEGVNSSMSNTNDVWYSDDGANWYELENTPWSVRHAAAVYAHDSALWIIGGNNMVSDIWKLKCEFDNLTTVNENKILKNKISFYPNPVNDILNVVINKNGLFNLTIYDANGKVVINDEIEKGQNSLNLKRLNSGVYFARIRSNELNEFFKIIKN